MVQRMEILVVIQHFYQQVFFFLPSFILMHARTRGSPISLHVVVAI